MKKLVEREKLEEFSHMLTDLYFNWTPGNILTKITDLQYFYNLHILEKPKEGMNEIKRELYKKIKNDGTICTKHSKRLKKRVYQHPC